MKNVDEETTKYPTKNGLEIERFEDKMIVDTAKYHVRLDEILDANGERIHVSRVAPQINSSSSHGRMFVPASTLIHENFTPNNAETLKQKSFGIGSQAPTFTFNTPDVHVDMYNINGRLTDKKPLYPTFCNGQVSKLYTAQGCTFTYLPTGETFLDEKEITLRFVTLQICKIYYNFNIFRLQQGKQPSSLKENVSTAGSPWISATDGLGLLLRDEIFAASPTTTAPAAEANESLSTKTKPRINITDNIPLPVCLSEEPCIPWASFINFNIMTNYCKLMNYYRFTYFFFQIRLYFTHKQQA